MFLPQPTWTGLVVVLMVLFHLPTGLASGHPVRYTFGSGVPGSDRLLVREAVSVGDAIFDQCLGRGLAAPVDVFVYADVDAITDAYMSYLGIPGSQRSRYRQRWADNCEGEAGSGWLFQCTLGHWTTDSTGLDLDVHRRRLILHEYVHNLQWEALASSARPVWLVEGMAEYLTFVYLDQEGLSHQDQMAFLLDRAEEISPGLGDYEDYPSAGTGLGRDGTDLSIAAVHVLVLRFGIDALMRFFEDLGVSGSWQTSFLNTFGITPTQFYSDFDSYRAAGFATGDSDFDGVPDESDPDDDNDSVSDIEEQGNGLDSKDPIDVCAAGRFFDVSFVHWAYRWVEALIDAGATGGCSASPSKYCPQSPVTRAQMAVFLERGMRGSGFLPPPATGNLFSDVSASHWAGGWIEQLFQDGITGGCSSVV